MGNGRRILRVFFAILLNFIIAIGAAAEGAHAKDTVILIHGFIGAPSDLGDIEQRLNEEGYQTLNMKYDSRSGTIEALADEVFERALSAVPIDRKVSIVTHSMGGLLARSYLERHSIPSLERMVMIAPPNHGSEVAGELSQYSLYREFSGPSGVELGALQLTPRKIGNYELGIIAGTASVNPIFSPILPGPDDGYVALESTWLLGMNDFITIPSSHGLITGNASTIEEIVHFLNTGQFDHSLPVSGFPFSTEDFLLNTR